MSSPVQEFDKKKAARRTQLTLIEALIYFVAKSPWYGFVFVLTFIIFLASQVGASGRRVVLQLLPSTSCLKPISGPEQPGTLVFTLIPPSPTHRPRARSLIGGCGSGLRMPSSGTIRP